MLPLEREVELEAIRELAADAVAGRGALMVLEGPPGLGKSMLLAQAEREAGTRGLAVLRARGHELEQSFAWGVARSLLEPSVTDELLDRAGPGVVFDAGAELGGRAGLQKPAPGSSTRCTGSTLRLAEAGRSLLVVDDAHWADEASLRYLVYLTGRLADQPIGGARRDPPAGAR